MIVAAGSATVNTHLDPATGTIDARWCCRDGRLDDPGDGSPAWLVRRADGTVVEARHYRRDRRIA